MSLPWRTPRIWRECISMNRRRDIPFAMPETSCSWEAAGIEPASPAAAGGTWRPLRERNFPEPRSRPALGRAGLHESDGAPYIGPYSRHTPDFFVATGFNKWGMTSSMAAALLLADLVQGKENPYAPVFSSFPQHSPSPAFRQHMGSPFQPSQAKAAPAARIWDVPCNGTVQSRPGTAPAMAPVLMPKGGSSTTRQRMACRQNKMQPAVLFPSKAALLQID